MRQVGFFLLGTTSAFLNSCSVDVQYSTPSAHWTFEISLACRCAKPLATGANVRVGHLSFHTDCVCCAVCDSRLSTSALHTSSGSWPLCKRHAGALADEDKRALAAAEGRLKAVQAQTKAAKDALAAAVGTTRTCMHSPAASG